VKYQLYIEIVSSKFVKTYTIVQYFLLEIMNT